MKIGSIDILKAYLGALELVSSNAFIGSIPIIDAAPVEPVPYDELWYTTSDGNIITPYQTSSLPEIDTNTYSGGKGIIKFKTNITNIGERAFKGCSSLASIEIPSSVTSIGEQAFKGCSSLASIEIPSSVTSIGKSAFDSCSSLASIEIPSSVTSIGEQAFYGCTGLTSVTIPNSVTSIGDWTFGDCSSMTSVTIPNSVTSIGNGAFQACRGLTSVTIGNNIETIGNGVFKGCSSLTSMTVPDSVITLGTNVFQNCGRLVSVVLPNNITTIPASTFQSCYKLESITIPSTVTEIKGNAFTDCVSLPTFTIPSTVTTVANTSFTHVNNIIHSLGTSTYGAKAKDGYVDGNLVYSDSTKTTLCGCFGNAVGEIVIPNTVTTINQYAFYYCDRITSVVNLSNITQLATYTFCNCKHMESTTIPSTVTKIVTYVFNNCHSLTSLTVPNSVTSIGTRAFSAVPNVVYSGTASGSPWNAHIVNGFVDGYFVYENSSKTDLMCCSRAITNHDFSGEIVIPDGVVNLRRYSIQDIVEMTSVVIPASVTHFYEYMLSGCDGLTNITFLGTIAQWNAITKDTNWNKKMNVTVAHCSDGDVQIA